MLNGDFSNGVTNWNAGGGATISVANNQLTIEADNDFNFYARQTVSGFIVGKQYKLTIDVAGGTTSKIQVGVFGEGILINNQPIVIGKQSVIFTITNGADGNRFLDINNRNDDGVNDTLIINSVSVKEYSGQEVVPGSGCGSWLWEPQSTNLVTQSETYGSGTFFSITSGSTIDNTTSLSPSGENNATQITSTGAGKIQSIALTTLSQNTDYSFSFYAKNVDATAVTSRVLAIGGSGGSNLTAISYVSELSTENWVRITHYFNTGTNTTFYLFMSNALNSGGTIQLWGAQLEQQTYSTSYIPTSGQASGVTRNQDVCTGGGSAASINSTEGVLYFEGNVLENTSSFEVISLSDGSTSNILGFVYRNIANQFTAVLKSGGSTSLSKTITLADATSTIKAAISYKLNDFKFYVNGVLIIADTTGNTPIGLNTLQFADGNGTSNKFFGKTKAVAVWKEPLSDEELAELTTI